MAKQELKPCNGIKVIQCKDSHKNAGCSFFISAKHNPNICAKQLHNKCFNPEVSYLLLRTPSLDVLGEVFKKIQVEADFYTGDDTSYDRGVSQGLNEAMQIINEIKERYGDK